MALKTNKVVSIRPIIFGIILLAATVVMIAVGQRALATGEVFSSPADKTIYETQSVAITDLQVNGSENDTLNMNLHTSGGSLQFSGSTTGLTFNGDSFGSTIQFSGSRSDINAALQTLRYTSNTPGNYTIEASLGGGEGDVYNTANGHVYQVLTVGGEGISWNDAKVAAEELSYAGTPGYLATITSPEEHEFIFNRLSQDGWIGASDSASEGDWKWVTGPEGQNGGTSFWNGTGVEGNVVEGQYENWNQSGETKEPNNGGGTENCGEVRFTGGANGEWNDRDCNASNMSYVVEYGEEGNLPTIESTSFQVTVNEAPAVAVTGFSPADNSQVAATNKLSLTFNQPMETGEGYINIYNASDDSHVAEVGTYDGTSEDGRTFTYTLENQLQPGSYYVTISEWGYDGIVGHHQGFDDKTTWNFEIVGESVIPEEVENAAPNGGDGNNDGIQDADQANVASYVDEVTGDYAVLEVNDECTITSVTTAAESTETKDESYAYPVGLMDFTLDCGTPGFSATINQYYYGVSNDAFVVRKYNPTTATYATIDTAAISKQTIDSTVVTKATYVVVDGGDLDLDGEENGEIVDPAGLALRGGVGSAPVTDIDTLNAPNTGFNQQLTSAAPLVVGLATILTGFGLVAYIVKRKNI